MPYVHIRLLSQRPPNIARLGAEATRLMAEVMHKRREVTVVEVVTTHSDWFANGVAVGGAAAYVDVKITRSTNTTLTRHGCLRSFRLSSNRRPALWRRLPMS